jgi:hypothetical protein
MKFNHFFGHYIYYKQSIASKYVFAGETQVRTRRKYKYSQHISSSEVAVQLMSSDGPWFRNRFW